MVFVPPKVAGVPRPAHLIDEGRLLRFLAENVEACRGATSVLALQFRGGQSNPTYWLGVSGGVFGDVELVLRKKPPGELLPSAHAVEREFRVMRSLLGTGVPVPETLALCEDASVIGTPFFVMRHVAGRIFWDPRLPEVATPVERAAIYEDFIGALAALHSVDYAARGLADYGKVGGFVERQVARWSKQYEASRTGEVPAMEALMAFLARHVPKGDETTLVHGDYRIDNIIFSADSEKALAIIDWELSTLGHPISDLAYLCMGYYLALPGRGSLVGADFRALGIPTESELIASYCRKTGRAELPDWPYFMAFGVFRLAAIAQGVYKRSLQGNASSESASAFGAAVFALADLGCSFVNIRPNVGVSS